MGRSGYRNHTYFFICPDQPRLNPYISKCHWKDDVSEFGTTSFDPQSIEDIASERVNLD
jgi:hypothetical protein